ncbi:MAG: hypothetical protein ACRD06_01580 [Terriglobia bacterium]
MPILVVVEDLIFLSKIRQTAKLIDITLEDTRPAQLRERLTAGPVNAVICDLNYRAGLALEAIREIKHIPALRPIPMIGFLSHVQADLAVAARDAGCDLVMARSAFAAQLPQLLRRYAANDVVPPSAVSHAE